MTVLICSVLTGNDSGLSGLVALLRKRLSDPSPSVRRQVLLFLAIFCERLGVEAPQGFERAPPLPAPARVYKQILPAVAECLADSDRKVGHASASLSYAALSPQLVRTRV